ncbi:MAG: HAMP domain-containing histidine kinase [Chloroflexi bacterium]|nr:HAMP domain-containing histidine kinase [Chloroflexota bacterium]MCH8340742.1 HAMP domain-containing histidine kinase [Chloroflexota bacterium]TDI84924.1 MAG: HAMP domain-containing histidine kinase [Chloroflexota bacterium]
MFRSLRARLLLTHMLVSALVLILVAVSLLVFLINSRQLDELTTRRLRGAAELVAERGPRVLQFLGTDRLNAAFRNLGVPNARGMIVGQEGAILNDTRPGDEPPPADVIQAAASRDPDTHGGYGGLFNRWLYVAQPLGEGRSLLLLAPRPNPVAAIGQELLLPLILRAALVALAASLVLAWLISRWVSAPLKKTAEAARSVAAGDYDQRLAPSGPDEAHSLATSFNEMVQQVQGSQQAMRDFVANVSHDLRTPLTSIQGYAQAILDGTASDVKNAAGVIYDESDRLGRLVEQLLDLARMDAGQAPLDRRPVDLGAILAAIVERLKLKADKKNIRIQNPMEPLPKLIGDGDRLAQVFTNLIDNALKHTPEGGEVRLKTEVSSGWVAVHVDDTGPGISSEDLSRIFERFYQLDKSRSGSGPRGAGLGLAISREIVQAHGGSLEAQSVVGRGSRFTVRLPIVQPDDETLARPQRQ